MARSWQVVRAFDRGTSIFLLVCALDAFGYFGVQAVLFNLYLLRLGVGAHFIGLLIASGQLMWALAAFPAAALSRRLGVRAALILAFAFAALGMGVVLLVDGLPRPLWTAGLVGGWAVLWVGTAFYSVNSPPYLMHVTTPQTRTHAFAAQGAVVAVMGFVGSVAAGVLPGLVVGWTDGSLAHPDPYRAALWLAPVAYLLCALLWIGAPPVRVVHPTEARSTASPPRGLFVFFVVLVVVQTASEGVLPSFFAVYLDTHLGVPTAQLGTIMGSAQLLSLVGVLAVPALVRRCGAPATLMWTMLGLGGALLPLALLPQWLPATIGFMSGTTLSAMNGPLRSMFSQDLVRPQWRITTSALLTIGLAVGWASSAAVGGQVIAQAGFGLLFGISTVLALAGAVLLWGYRRWH